VRVLPGCPSRNAIAIGSHVQFGRDLADICALVVPVDARRREVRATEQQSPDAAPSARTAIGGIVFAADCEQDTSLSQIAKRPAAPPEIRGAGMLTPDLDAPIPSSPMDTSPQRVVEIRHQNFETLPVSGWRKRSHSSACELDSAATDR